MTRPDNLGRFIHGNFFAIRSIKHHSLLTWTRVTCVLYLSVQSAVHPLSFRHPQHGCMIPESKLCGLDAGQPFFRYERERQELTSACGARYMKNRLASQLPSLSYRLHKSRVAYRSQLLLDNTNTPLLWVGACDATETGMLYRVSSFMSIISCPQGLTRHIHMHTDAGNFSYGKRARTSEDTALVDEWFRLLYGYILRSVARWGYWEDGGLMEYG